MSTPAPTFTPDLTIVIPAYNEAARIAEPLRQIAAYLDGQPYSSEIVVIDDGSTDATADAVISILTEIEIPAQLCTYASNRGKGYALKVGFERAQGARILFTDADLASPIDQCSKLLAVLERGALVAIGSRKMPGAEIRVHQPWYRERLGKVFTFIVRQFIADVTDVTCGFKAFDREVGRALFRMVRLYDWSFDAEILMLAARQRLPIIEVPVVWEDQRGTKVRLVRDVVRSLAGLARLRWYTLNGTYRAENMAQPALTREWYNAAWQRQCAGGPRQQSNVVA